MFRSFVLRSLLVFVFSTSPFAGYAFTPSTPGCDGEILFEDFGVVSIDGNTTYAGAVYVSAVACGYVDAVLHPAIPFGEGPIGVINNTRDDGLGLLSGGVYLLVSALLPGPLADVEWGGGSLVPYGGVPLGLPLGVVYRIPNSSKDEAFDEFLTWVYLGAPYYARVRKAENSTTVRFGPVTAGVPPTEPAQAAALAFGQVATKLAASSTFSRIGCRLDDALGCGTQGSQADFTDSGWTRISSDDVTSMVARNAAQLANEKIEGLDLEALGLADEAIEAVGLDKAALDFYASAAWGSLERKGTAGYDGYGYITTAGADYLLTPDLLLGGCATVGAVMSTAAGSWTSCCRSKALPPMAALRTRSQPPSIRAGRTASAG